MKLLKHVLMTLLLLTLFLIAAFFLLSIVPIPNHIDYGVTFSKLRADELKLDWKETYLAILNDLNVKKLRLVAHWPMVEPTEGQYDFNAIDYQMSEASTHKASVILAIGRRLPSWPECHVPEWAKKLSTADEDQALLSYMTATVKRYKDSPALRYWQVENEPFIIGYAYLNCGTTDSQLLEKEIAFIHRLDPAHPVVLTASGELGLWNHTWNLADVFGTTIYRYVWNGDLKLYLTYPTTPSFFRAKYRLTELMTSTVKPSIVSELAAEPWPVGPIVDTPVEIQIARMTPAMFEGVVAFAAHTPFSEQYFWGAEWWYYMKTVMHHPEYWDYAKKLFHE